MFIIYPYLVEDGISIDMISVPNLDCLFPIRILIVTIKCRAFSHKLREKQLLFCSVDRNYCILSTLMKCKIPLTFFYYRSRYCRLYCRFVSYILRSWKYSKHFICRSIECSISPPLYDTGTRNPSAHFFYK